MRKGRPQTPEERIASSKRMKLNNPNKGKAPWLNSRAKDTQTLWKLADKIFEIWKKTDFGYHKIAGLIKCKNRKTLQNMILRFQNGWDPVNDQDWIDFTLNTPRNLPYSEKLDRLLKRTQRVDNTGS